MAHLELSRRPMDGGRPDKILMACGLDLLWFPNGSTNPFEVDCPACLSFMPIINIGCALPPNLCSRCGQSGRAMDVETRVCHVCRTSPQDRAKYLGMAEKYKRATDPYQ